MERRYASRLAFNKRRSGADQQKKPLTEDFVNLTSLGVTTTFIDPLVLQFDMHSPQLSDSSFFFDLDSDGSEGALACPGRGCGFLAFDRNGDGRINHSLELFGPSSGFQLENGNGKILGMVRASGIFLTEAGEVRSLQEVNLATPPKITAGTKPVPGGEFSEDNQLEEALLSLRAFFGMQRLRLRVMLTGQQLQSRMEKIQQRQWLFKWLETRSAWQGKVGDASGQRGAAEAS